MSKDKMAEVYMENCDSALRTVARAGDIVLFDQAATANLAKQVPIVVPGSFSNIFSRLSTSLSWASKFRVESNAFARPSRTPLRSAPCEVPIRLVSVTETNGEAWSQKVGELPPNI